MDENEKLDLIATGMYSYDGHPVVAALVADLWIAVKDSDIDASQLRAIAEVLGGLWEYEDARLRGLGYLGPMDMLRMLEVAATGGGCEQQLAAAFEVAAKRKAELEPEDYLPDDEKVQCIEWELNKCPWCDAEVPDQPMTRESLLGLSLEEPSLIGKCKECGGELQTGEALTLRTFARGRSQGVEPRPLREYMEGGDPQWCIVGAVLVTEGQTVDGPVVAHSMLDDGSLVCSVLQSGGEYVDNFAVNPGDHDVPFHFIVVAREVEGEAKAVAADALKSAGS